MILDTARNNNQTRLRKSPYGIWGVGEKLVLPNKRLIFKLHNLNVQSKEESIVLKEIIRAEAKGNNFLLRKITIHLRDNSVDTFFVDRRKNWVQQIPQAKKD